MFQGLIASPKAFENQFFIQIIFQLLYKCNKKNWSTTGEAFKLIVHYTPRNYSGILNPKTKIYNLPTDLKTL